MKWDRTKYCLVTGAIRLGLYAVVFGVLYVTDKAVATFVAGPLRPWVEKPVINDLIWAARAYATFPGLLAAVLFLLLVDRRKWRQLAVGALLLLVTTGVTELGKECTSRVRPEESLLVQKVTVRSHIGHNSFPSGHATTAFSVYASVSRFFPRLGPVFLFLAVACSLSRVLLLRHYPSDVFGGALIGYFVTKWLLDSPLLRWTWAGQRPSVAAPAEEPDGQKPRVENNG